MTAEASVDQAIPTKTTLFVQSIIRGLILVLVSRLFPDLSANPNISLVIDLLAGCLTAAGLAWVSATATRRHALNAVVTVLETPPVPTPPT